MTEINPHYLENFPKIEVPEIRLEPSCQAVEVVDVELSQTDWYALAQSLGQQNQNLQQTIVHLEQALSDAQQNLQNQTRRFRSMELMNQQTQVNQTPEKVERLVSELESSQQTIQQQQSIINHLSAQLEKTQGQLAYLERECALLQEEKTGKTHQLLTAEKHMGELQARLHRQQRYTLQYKSALEQFSDQETRTLAKIIPLVPKTAPIQPWTNVEQEIEAQTNQTMNTWDEQTSNDDQTESSLIAEPEFEVLEPNLDDLDEFLAELEDGEPILQAPEVPQHSKNWSFSIMPSRSTWKKTASKSVDLPTFLREQSS